VAKWRKRATTADRPTLDSLKAHLDAFTTAYNFAKHRKSLRWRTPFQAICDAWTSDPKPFINQPAPSHSGTTHLGYTRR
jgi:hypothetical protein